jgi:predicted metal-dependent phosphoesterase TrpH
MLARSAIAAGLDAIAITDHDECRGGLELAELCAKLDLPLTVIAGSEITAREGRHDVHVIGLNLTSNIRPWQSVAATVEQILAQGAVPVLPHPKPDGRGHPSYRAILDLQVPVAVEVYNSAIEDLRRFHQRQSGVDVNRGALEFYERHSDQLLGAIGGTDAHFRSVGRGLTAYHGDLLEAIRESRTVVVRRADRESLRPWDLVGYWRGLRRLSRRRELEWGARPAVVE